MLMNELNRGDFLGSEIFEGEPGPLLPVNNSYSVSTHFYEMVGKMVLHSLISLFNKCRCLEGVLLAVSNCVASGNRDSVLAHLTLRDIPDPCLCRSIDEVGD